eukprot:1668445-Rhodomonas_salina.1
MQNKVANEEAAITKKAAGEERHVEGLRLQKEAWEKMLWTYRSVLQDKAAAVAERGEPAGRRWAAEAAAQKATIPMLKPVVQLFNSGRLQAGVSKKPQLAPLVAGYLVDEIPPPEPEEEDVVADCEGECEGDDDDDDEGEGPTLNRELDSDLP